MKSALPARVVLAFDKFKDTMSAQAVCDTLAKKFKGAGCEEVVELPISDGGDGFVECMHRIAKELRDKKISNVFFKGVQEVEMKQLEVQGPLNEPVKGEYLVIKEAERKHAVIEVANLSGLQLVPIEKRDPFLTMSKVIHDFDKSVGSRPSD